MSVSCIMNRRSVRDYTDAPVSAEELDTLLRAGMYAPSAKNSQPWEFVVIRDRDALDSLSGACQYWGMLKKAPLAIAVLANLDGYKSSTRDFFAQDCAACTQNILAAAEGLSLGGVWLGVYGVTDRMAAIASALHVPDNILPFSLLALGHPASHPHPHAFFHEGKVHYERYE